jgi:CBS domain-containing protein
MLGEPTAMVDHAGYSSELRLVRVRDCMHHGILSCDGDATLGEVAGVMSKHRVHSVAVTNHRVDRPVGIISDLDVVAALASGEEPCAAQVAATEPVAVSAEDSLGHAAQLMAEHGVSHLVVLDAASGYPSGILSTLDIAAAYARE